MAASIHESGGKETVEKAGYKTLPGGGYRSMWWVFHNAHGALAARGVHGQTVYVDPTAGWCWCDSPRMRRQRTERSTPPPSEYWVPAEELEELNEDILGPIEVIGEYSECDT